MIVLDVNILVAAFRQDHPHHATALPWLSNVLAGYDEIAIPDAVWTGFLRIVTHPAAMKQPSSLQEAAAFIRDLTSAPAYASGAHVERAVERLVELCQVSQATGNLVPDAYIASIALAYGCPVATFDRDFRRFDGLAIITPTAP